MRFMLDTNICIYLIRKKPERVIRRLRRIDVSDICISAVTLSELRYGVEKSVRKDQNALALAAFIAPLEVMAYDDRAAAHYGRIRAELEARGRPIGALDMLIAAHARSQGLTLVTNNDEEFRRVAGLRVQSWAK